MYNYGSEARRIEYTEALEIEKKREERENKERRARVMAERRRKAAHTKAIRSLIIVAAILGVIMVENARIDQLCGEVSAKSKELDNLQAVVTEKEMYLSGALDLNMVEDIATSRLGMKKPDQAQYVYVQLNSSDTGEVLSKPDGENKGFTAFINKVKILLEYLY